MPWEELRPHALLFADELDLDLLREVGAEWAKQIRNKTLYYSRSGAA